MPVVHGPMFDVGRRKSYHVLSILEKATNVNTRIEEYGDLTCIWLQEGLLMDPYSIIGRVVFRNVARP